MQTVAKPETLVRDAASLDLPDSCGSQIRTLRRHMAWLRDRVMSA